LCGGTEENHKESVRIAGPRAKILTRDLPNTKQECQPLGRDVQYSRNTLGVSDVEKMDVAARVVKKGDLSVTPC
jgi:hypothetical protein